MNTRNKKLFILTESDINGILFCDTSDTEGELQLDVEDLGFLENDVDDIEKSGHNEEPVEVLIKPPQAKPAVVTEMTSQKVVNLSFCSSNDLLFKWQKQNEATDKQQQLSHRRVEYGKIFLHSSEDSTPHEAFNQASNFENFPSEVVIPQTILYSQQQGHVFTTSLEKIKAFWDAFVYFLGMHFGFVITHAAFRLKVFNRQRY